MSTKTSRDWDADPIDWKKLKKENPAIKSCDLCKKYITKADLQYYYIEQNVGYYEIGKPFGLPSSPVIGLMREYGIRKPRQAVQQLIAKTNLEKYGRVNVFQGKEGKEMARKGFYKKYGANNPGQVFELQQKVKKTMLEKYGVVNAHQGMFIEKARQTNINRYGGPAPMCDKTIQDKTKNTNLKKYGTSWNITSDYHNLIAEQTRIQKHENPDLRTVILEDGTKRYADSYEEKLIFTAIHSKYPDVIIHHRDEKYPWVCDFYIPSTQTYIEYQGTWKHGFEPFDECNSKHIEKLALWKSKMKEHNNYKAAVETWSIKDPKKRLVAKQNNVKLVEIWPKDVCKDNPKRFFESVLSKIDC